MRVPAAHGTKQTLRKFVRGLKTALRKREGLQPFQNGSLGGFLTRRFVE